MLPNRIQSAGLLVIFLLLPGISHLHAQVVPTSSGPVEFIGLRTWRPAQLVDSLKEVDSLLTLTPGNRHALGDPHRWGSLLFHHFGFPAVAVTPYPDSTGSIYWVIGVLEPVDSSKIRQHPDITAPIGTVAPLSDWEGLDSIPMWHPELWKLSVGTFGYIASGKVAEGRAAIRRELEERNRMIGRTGSGAPIAPADVEQVWLRIAQLTRPDYRKLALKVLATDSNVHNRAVAAAVLGNFSHDDGTWRALMAAQLDRWSPVSSTARRVLTGFARHLARPVDWSYFPEHITAILDGSNLEGFTDLLLILDATEISVDLAAEILPGHEHLLLAYLAASHERERVVAHRFLVRMAGRDLGRDPAVWRKWIAGLERRVDR